MSTDRADKTTPKKTPQLTNYEVFIEVPSEAIVAAHSADDAMRRWALAQGEEFAGGRLMAAPARSVKRAKVTVETKRQLTLGTP